MRNVLIHLTLEVDIDDDEEAERYADEYLRSHNIPTEDITDVEAI